MRKRTSSGGVTVNAIAGTHVVMLGFDLTESVRKKCLGFAIQREDRTEDERYWLSGMKTFAATDPGLGPGGQISSHKHPFQAFQWADYSAKPAHDYSYRVIAMIGQGPDDMHDGPSVTVKIRTEDELGHPHSVFFNRGSVASQEYARRFQDKRPDQLTGEDKAAAYTWLSRGLLEALTAFIARAKGKSYGIHGAIYEFQWTDALLALKRAAATGAKVRIIYDGIPNAKHAPLDKNVAQIDAEHIKALSIPRTTGKIMHNKFLVLTKNGKPVAVWTGSTNWTENGLFGHSNCGHIVEDPALAAAYLAYWEELKSNPDRATEQAWMATNNASPPDPWDSDITAVFSPHSSSAVLDWYADIAGSAKHGLFMTFAFGMGKGFRTIYERDDNVLRYALMDKEGTGSTLEESKIAIRRIRARRNVIIAVGNKIATNSFDRWLKERSGLTTNVQWVHTKFMLVDPLGTRPVVVTGSANFSQASTDTNNENMLIIRGDRRVADIYLGEYMRLHAHYAFREAVKIALETGEKFEPQHLVPNPSWTNQHFGTSQKSLRRAYFAGSPAA